MKKLIPAVCLSFLIPFQAHAGGVPIVFEFPADKNPSNVFVQFLTSSTNFKAMCRDHAGNPSNLYKNTAYSLADLTSPISVGGGAPSNEPAILVSNFISGRVYFNYGSNGLAGMSDTYIPAAQTESDPNFRVRYGYLEPTILNSEVTVDLTYIDFVGLSLSLEAVNAPHAENNPQLSAYGRELEEAVVASALNPGSNVLPNAAAALPSTNFARVIAPQLRGDLYPSWSNYCKVFLQGKTNTLKGLFAGVGAQPSGTPKTQMQTYEFKVTFNTNGDALLVATTNSGDGYTYVSAHNQGPGVGHSNQYVQIAFADLDSIQGIYGNDPSYTIVDNGTTTTTVSIQNDYYGWVVGDLMAGLSFGFLSSTVDFKGKAIGEYYSAEWWGAYIADGVQVPATNSPGHQGLYFSKAQPDHPHNYHGFAAGLEPLTPGYGFALQDRLGKNLLKLNTLTDTNGYLIIRLNEDENPQPALTIDTTTDAVILRWPATNTGFQLTSQAVLTGTNWTAVPITPAVDNSKLVVTSPVADSIQFYRLKK